MSRVNLKRSKESDHNSFQINAKESRFDETESAVTNLFFPNPQQFRESCLPQEFSFSMPFIKYVLFSSPEVYEKLIKCCKLFFIRNQILVIKNMQYYNETGWKYCNSNKCVGKYSCKNKHKIIYMDKLKWGVEGKKIWVSKTFRICDLYENTAAFFIPKIYIYRYDVKVLVLSDQKLSYNDFKILSSGVQECNLFWNCIKYDNGEEVPLENVIQLYSGAKKINIDFGVTSYNAACKNYNNFIDVCNTIQEVQLYRIPSAFNVVKFYQHLKISSNSHALIRIHSLDNISRLNEVINEILEREFFGFIPPIICYHEQDKTEVTKMEKLQATEAAKYH